eukprot:9309191-Pyramimonas_sp.AAC.1
MTLPFRAAFEAVNEELLGDASVFQVLDGPADGRPQCALDTRAYHNHPAVVRAREANEPKPLPLGFYLDGICYQNGASGRQDTVLWFWAINL